MCRYILGDDLAYEASVIPANAGIHPLTPLDAGSAGMTDQGKNHMMVRKLQFHLL
jgi:hypothetical protein